MSRIKVKIITPDKVLLETKTNMCILPGTSGEFAVLENHEPLVSSLKDGLVILVDEEGRNHSKALHDSHLRNYEVKNALVKVMNNCCTILALTCQEITKHKVY